MFEETITLAPCSLLTITLPKKNSRKNKNSLLHLMWTVAHTSVSTCATGLMHVKYSTYHSCLRHFLLKQFFLFQIGADWWKLLDEIYNTWLRIMYLEIKIRTSLNNSCNLVLSLLFLQLLKLTKTLLIIWVQASSQVTDSGSDNQKPKEKSI